MGYGFESLAQVSDRVSPGNELSRTVVGNKFQQLQVERCLPVFPVINSWAISLERPTTRESSYLHVCADARVPLSL